MKLDQLKISYVCAAQTLMSAVPFTGVFVKSGVIEHDCSTGTVPNSPLGNLGQEF